MSIKYIEKSYSLKWTVLIYIIASKWIFAQDQFLSYVSIKSVFCKNNSCLASCVYVSLVELPVSM